MKNKLSTILLLSVFAAGLFNSCDNLGFEIDQTFNKVFDVNFTEDQSGGGNAITASSIDLSDGDLKDNIDQIDELRIKSISISFSEYTGDTTAMINGAIGFPQLLTNEYNMPEINVHDLARDSMPYVLFSEDGKNFDDDKTFPADQFVSNLIDFLKTLPADQLNFNYKATSSKYPVAFKANVEIDVFAKVSPIE